MSGIHLQLKLAHSGRTVLDVDLSLPSRGASAILGSSGAGKTTLLRAVAGLESASRGRVEINDEVWQDDAQNVFLPVHRRSIGYVFQEASLFPHLSVQGNLEFGLRRISVADQKVSLSHAVELLGIAPLLSRFPETLSGGERQRVGIARALAVSPKLLLMDEPLASLDEQRKAEILPYLERLHNELEIPLLYVSHVTDEVARLADYAVILEEGRVRASGNVVELLTRPDLPFAHGDQASSLIDAKIIAHDAQYQLFHVEFAGGRLWLPQTVATVGATVRLRILARDVSMSLAQQVGSSILNSLSVKISALNEDTMGLLMVELDAGGTKLLARITKKSADQLALYCGMSLFAQIKGVALLG